MGIGSSDFRLTVREEALGTAEPVFLLISLGASIDLTVEARLSRCLSSLSLGFGICQPSDPSKTYLALV